MMAEAAAELKRVEKKKKRQTKKAKADQQKRRCRIESSDTDTDTGTQKSDLEAVDKDGFDTDEESYSKEQPFDFQGDQAMEQD